MCTCSHVDRRDHWIVQRWSGPWGDYLVGMTGAIFELRRARLDRSSLRRPDG